MSFRMYRVFCATPSDAETDLEVERHAFYEVVGQLNEDEAMPEGILFVPVSILPNLTNLIVFQHVVDENVRACAFFVQLLQHTWGPATRNFEPRYRLATECCTGVSVFFKASNGLPIETGVAQLKESLSPAVEFESLDDFRSHLRSQLSAWLQSAKNS
jgi:hypothetical protein